MNYQEALESGVVIIGKTWDNKNKPEQMTVQFVQQQENELIVEPENFMGLLAQGVTNKPSNVHALVSFKKEVATKLGIKIDYDYEANDEVVLASDLSGKEVNLQIVESTTPTYPTQSPKINPQTNEVLLLGDKEIYRNVLVVPGVANHVRIKHDKTRALAGVGE